MRGGMYPQPKAVQRKALRDTTRDTSGPRWYPPVGHLSSVRPDPGKSDLRVSHALRRHPCLAPPPPPGPHVKALNFQRLMVRTRTLHHLNG